MKIVLSPCPTCVDKNRADGLPMPSWILAPVRQDQIYVRTCDRGHTFLVCYQHQHFDMLYMAGLNALVDGYFRDAVTSFVACLERFYMHYAEEALHHNSIPQDEIDKSAKIASLSERQFGFFVTAYLFTTHKAPRNIDKTHVGKRDFKNYRNEVIHNGLLPSKAEAKEVGQAVFDYIKEICGNTDFMKAENGAHIVSGHMQLKTSLKLWDSATQNASFDGHPRSGQGGGTILVQAISNQTQWQTIDDQLASPHFSPSV